MVKMEHADQQHEHRVAADGLRRLKLAQVEHATCVVCRVTPFSVLQGDRPLCRTCATWERVLKQRDRLRCLG
jgi:hypothetical protein